MKKRISLILSSLLLTAGIYSLPGINPILPDSPGEYVFYADKTFARESYVGFVTYSSDTYAARFYSPASLENNRKEQDISIYITVNPLNANLEFTGEKIVGASTVEDAEIVNYLHDLFYEFTGRRKKILEETINENFQKNGKYISEQDFAQFGGKVKIQYNPLIPLFNMTDIFGVDGKPVFTLCTIGTLSDTNDLSFSEFKGINGLPKDKERNFEISKKAKPVEYSSGAQFIKLDSQWTQSMENLWFLGDYALITITEMEIPRYENKDDKYYLDLLTKHFIKSTNFSYFLWQHSKIESEKKSVKISSLFYEPKLQNVTRDFKILTNTKDGKVNCLTLTVFDNIYQQNKKYFDAIIKSYKSN